MNLAMLQGNLRAESGRNSVIRRKALLGVDGVVACYCNQAPNCYCNPSIEPLQMINGCSPCLVVAAINRLLGC